VRYLTEREKAEVIDGNAELFEKLARTNPYKTKTYNFLISFKESKEELERKLARQGKTIRELYEEVFSYIFPPEFYERESLNVLAVGHYDTEHYHIHLTVENRDYARGKSLYIPFTKNEVEFYRALERYISAKYGLSLGMRMHSKGKSGVEKVKQILEQRGEYKEKTRDEVKEEITHHLTEQILWGRINSREELILYLARVEGIEIKRVGRNYISFEYEGERYRLKGGIYDEERFKEIRRALTGTGKNLEEVGQLFERVRRERERFIARRLQRTHQGVAQRPEQGNERTVATTPTADTGDKRAIVLGNCGSNSARVSSGHRAVCHSEVNLNLPSFRVVGKRKKSACSTQLERVIRLIEERREEELRYLKEVLDPREVLSYLGVEYKEMGGYLLARSPIREDDTEPSFSVFWDDRSGCWRWKDHGTGESGTMIDLWMRVRNLDYVDAVKEMREIFIYDRVAPTTLGELKEFVNKQSESSSRLKEKKITHAVVRVGSVEKMREYLKKRGIREIPEWLNEVEYIHLESGKRYVGVGVRNLSGAWNIRSEGGKYVVRESPEQGQTFSLIRRGENNKKLIVVEGLFDALSLEQVRRKKDYDIVVLNSTENSEEFVHSGIAHEYDRLILALDNDDAGIIAKQRIVDGLYEQGFSGEILELEYEGKDLNDALVKGLLTHDKVGTAPIYPSYHLGFGPRLRP
jgi:hypothetical protein